MKNLLNPKWLLLVNTLPILVLFVLLSGQYSIIKTLLDANSTAIWKNFGWTLAILGMLNLLYTLWLIFKNQAVHLAYSAVALICYIAFIYLYTFYGEQLFPSTIPNWMLSGNVFLYVGTFLMPTIAYAVLIILLRFTSEADTNAGANFGIAIAVPVVGYLFSQIVLPLWQKQEGNFSMHAFLVLVIAGTLVFLFFLARGVLILAMKRPEQKKALQLTWKIPITIVLPLLGLAVNQGLIFGRLGFDSAGIFGDFGHPWFYILATLNGILLCVPETGNMIWRSLLFIARSILFAYTLYFFLVFLPFLPLSVFAILAIGTGFLMLAPLALFLVHCNTLATDFAFLRQRFSAARLVLVALGGFMVIPVFITITYFRDKVVLSETLDYLYQPDYNKVYHLDKASLERTLAVVKHHKERNNEFLFSTQVPYLSGYFNWLVLDNLSISDAKINYIEKVFFDTTAFKLRQPAARNDSVSISHITTNTNYDASQHAWKTWVNLDITNKTASDRPAEYATNIELPEGCWISDYYLDINGKREPGILAEKKAAMWVYANIVNQKKDPGILYYLSGNKVAFNVFPFSKGETRKTGIEFLHREPLKLRIDNNTIVLGDSTARVETRKPTNGIIYISAKEKGSLRSVQRTPYFHFLVDVSKNKNKNVPANIIRIEKLLADNPAIAANTQISFVNSYVHTMSIKGNWKQQYAAATFDGGFFLDRAIRKSLINAPRNNTYPLFVVVSGDLRDAVLDKDFSDLRFAFPETDLFYRLTEKQTLEPHSLVSQPIKALPDSAAPSFFHPVLAYDLPGKTVAYLPANDGPSIILQNEDPETRTTKMQEKNWESALRLEAAWRSQLLHPETTAKSWPNLVRQSFQSKIMTPSTSYLVVENEAQKAMLKKKQEQILSGNPSLDAGEETQRMSEPGFWILAILFGGLIWYRNRKQYAMKNAGNTTHGLGV